MTSTSAFLSLPRVPLIPDQILKDHNCFFPLDSRFRKAARLLQVLWLKDRNIEPGVHVRGEGDDAVVMPLHSNLSRDAADRGQNFLNQDIHAFVRRSLVLAEEGACIDKERLFSNSVSSVPATYNIFASLALDLELATSVFRTLFPTFVDKVEDITFETAPLGRRQARGLNDGTAFDVAVQAIDSDGQPVSIFFEIKFTEEFPSNGARLRPEYEEVSRSCGLFVDPDSPILRTNAIEQYWREIMLSQLVVDEGLTEKAIFVAVAPRLNRSMQAAFRVFEHQLLDVEHRDDDRVSFVALTLEKLIDTIRTAGADDLARDLWARYCDFERVYQVALGEFAAEPSQKAGEVTPLALSTGRRKAASRAKRA